MEFRDTVNNLKAGLREEGSIIMFFDNKIRLAMDLVDKVSDVLFQLIEEDKEIEENIQLIKDVDYLNRTVLLEISLQDLNETTKEFLTQYSLMMFNWGSAIENETIMKSSKSIKLMIENLNTLEGLIAVTRNLIKYAKQFEAFSPPAFRVSKMYLDKIYSDLEEGVDLNDRNK